MLGAYGFSPELWKPNLLFRLGWGLKCLEDPTHPYFSHETQIFEHQIGWSFMKIRWCEVTCSVSRVLRVKCWPSWSCVLMVVCSAWFSLKFSSLLVVCLSYVSKYAACFNGFQLYIYGVWIFLVGYRWSVSTPQFPQHHHKPPVKSSWACSACRKSPWSSEILPRQIEIARRLNLDHRVQPPQSWIEHQRSLYRYISIYGDEWNWRIHMRH